MRLKFRYSTAKDNYMEERAVFDIHSHVLPGIDDGSKNWDMSMEMIRQSWEAGVRKIIATPHFLPWRHTIIAHQVPGLCQEAMERAKKELGIDIQIYPGQELYYAASVIDALAEGRALTLAGTRYVLVEFDEGAPYSDITDAVRRLTRNAYKPIIAHVERFSALRDEAHLDEIMSLGASLQSNAEEMQRGLFDKTKSWLKKRYQNEDIRFIGSDMHNLTSRPPITKKTLSWFDKHLEADYAGRFMWSNAVQLTGEE